MHRQSALLHSQPTTSSPGALVGDKPPLIEVHPRYVRRFTGPSFLGNDHPERLYPSALSADVTFASGIAATKG
jgi:hypothetical protein